MYKTVVSFNFNDEIRDKTGRNSMTAPGKISLDLTKVLRAFYFPEFILSEKGIERKERNLRLKKIILFSILIINK